MKRLFALWCLAIVLAYGVTGWLGMALAKERVVHAPQAIRQQPGGYRNFTYWRGGK